MKPIISVRNLSKKYTIGENIHGRGARTFRDIFDYKTKRLFRRDGKRRKEDTTLWALKDVSFDVDQGEVVGIIGRNGAGKSTLLKILSRITEPTEGNVTMRGRVASLLEVGTGFNQELTGRENIFLNGSILGMKKTEIKNKFDEIVSFAEIEKFIDTPVKRYSSGMYVRLAFAVAAHLEPEILVVDEVLAIGDAQFQKKCLGKMADVSRVGRTVLFVSHNMEAITTLCNKGILLEQGRIIESGAANQVISTYMERLGNALDVNNAVIEFKPDETKLAQILSINIKRPDETPSLVHTITSPIKIQINYVLRQDYANLIVGCQIRRNDGYLIYSTADADYNNYEQPAMQDIFDKPAGTYNASVTLPAPLLNTGRYELFVVLSIPRVDLPDIRRGIFLKSWKMIGEVSHHTLIKREEKVF
jgi:lipopolysaccharide transport system ATP-binding protein